MDAQAYMHAHMCLYTINIFVIRVLFKSLETLNNGKPYVESLEDIEHSVDVLRYYAGWCDKIHGQTIPVGEYYHRALTNYGITTIPSQEALFSNLKPRFSFLSLHLWLKYFGHVTCVFGEKPF